MKRFSKSADHPNIVMTSRNQETIKRMVANGIGYTLSGHYLEIFGSFDYLDCYAWNQKWITSGRVVTAYYGVKPTCPPPCRNF